MSMRPRASRTKDSAGQFANFALIIASPIVAYPHSIAKDVPPEAHRVQALDHVRQLSL